MDELLSKVNSILYVEDEQGIRDELEEFLQHFCEKLYVAKNGAQGLELYKKYTPEVIITDIKMPVMDGLDMAEEIKKIDDEAELIFTTAFNDSEYMLRAIELHATSYISKPINLDILTKTLQKSVEVYTLKENLAKKKKTIEEYLKVIDTNVLTSSTDLEGNIAYVSTAFCKLNGYTKEELIGASHSILKHEDTDAKIYEEMWRRISQDKRWSGELKNRKKDGTFYWIKIDIYPIYDENNVKVGYTSIRQDITNLKKIQELSIRDALTGLYNRRHFNEAFPKYIQSSKRSNDLVCFSILDIDYFKQYNDTYGHQRGDEALIAVANSMQESLGRANDLLFRLGGEEFGILFKSSSKESAVHFLNRVIKNVHALQLPHRTSKTSEYLSISAGLVFEYAASIVDEYSLYKKADNLLYEAKGRGRNRVVADERVIKKGDKR